MRAFPDPGFESDEVLVSVRACGVSRLDLGMRTSGESRATGDPGESIPGMEPPGTIEALGAGVQGWLVGGRVMAHTSGGGYGSKLAVHAGLLVPRVYPLAGVADVHRRMESDEAFGKLVFSHTGPAPPSWCYHLSLN